MPLKAKNMMVIMNNKRGENTASCRSVKSLTICTSMVKTPLIARKNSDAVNILKMMFVIDFFLRGVSSTVIVTTPFLRVLVTFTPVGSILVFII
tara:strand:- start:1705 stop:1986 length:282 start_codon:yes stop_codon:yes gene_type:complete